MSSSPIAQCTACGKRCTANEFLALIPAGMAPNDNIGRLKTYCEQCYCAMGMTGGRARWQRAMRDPGPCACRFEIVGEWQPGAPRQLIGDACQSCWDREWYLTNVVAVLQGLRTATKRKPGIGFRAYNRLGRCVSWSE